MNKMLMIDDDPVITAVYERHFRAAGFDVKTASDGQAGLAVLNSYRPDVVLLDLSMPNFNGIQWLNEIRSDERFKKLPVVVFTAGAIGWQVRAARNSEVTFVLSKDGADPKEVINSVNAALASGTWRLDDNLKI
jgi:CheY-like chemotaxis protein